MRTQNFELTLSRDHKSNANYVAAVVNCKPISLTRFGFSRAKFQKARKNTRKRDGLAFDDKIRIGRKLTYYSYCSFFLQQNVFLVLKVKQRSNLIT